MIFEYIYMIRNGSVGINYESKLIFTIVSFIICLYDWKQNKRKDYFWIFLIGSIFWTLVELSLHLSGTRKMVPPYLFGAEIPRFFGILLQGTFEGAFMGVLGVFFGDRMMNPETRKKYIVIYAVVLSLLLGSTLLQRVPTKDVGGDVASRRQMFGITGTIFLLSIVAINLIWLWKRANKTQRNRIIYMFIVMFLFTTVWTIGAYIANTRWIEVGVAPDNLNEASDNLRQAPPLLGFAALNYNNAIEFASAYVLFIIIPYELKLIRIDSEILKNDELVSR